jgi:hypothetical protein
MIMLAIRGFSIPVLLEKKWAGKHIRVGALQFLVAVVGELRPACAESLVDRLNLNELVFVCHIEIKILKQVGTDGLIAPRILRGYGCFAYGLIPADGESLAVRTDNCTRC